MVISQEKIVSEKIEKSHEKDGGEDGMRNRYREKRTILENREERKRD